MGDKYEPTGAWQYDITFSGNRAPYGEIVATQGYKFDITDRLKINYFNEPPPPDERLTLVLQDYYGQQTYGNNVTEVLVELQESKSPSFRKCGQIIGRLNEFNNVHLTHGVGVFTDLVPGCNANASMVATVHSTGNTSRCPMPDP